MTQNDKLAVIEFGKILDKLLAKKNENNLIFSKDDFSPMEFCIDLALTLDEGIVLKKFKILIETYGGILRFNMSSGGRHVIKLVREKATNFFSDDDLFLAQFIIDSLEANKLQNLCEYRACKTKYTDIDPNHIMRGLKSWEDAKRIRDKEETTNVVIDSSEEENVKLGGPSNSERPTKMRKKFYTIDEERIILNYIIKRRYYFRVKGNAIWKNMEEKKVCGSRSWQSMKERYVNHIIPKIQQFHLQPLIENKLMMPFSDKNINISLDSKGDSKAKNSNNNTNEELRDDAAGSDCDSDGAAFCEILDNDEPSCGSKRVHEDVNENDGEKSNQINLESVIDESCDANLNESKVSETAVSSVEKDTSEQEVQEPLSNNKINCVPNTSDPKSFDKLDEEICDDLLSIWNSSNNFVNHETNAGTSRMNSDLIVPNSLQNYDTGQEKTCMASKFNDSQNEEGLSCSITSTQSFKPKLNNISVNIGPKVDELVGVQENDQNNSKPQTESTQSFKPKLNNISVNIGPKVDQRVGAQENQDNSKLQTENLISNTLSHTKTTENKTNAEETNHSDSDSSVATIIFENSGFNQSGKDCNKTGNTSEEIPLQIKSNSSVLDKKKSQRIKPSESNSESESEKSLRRKKLVKKALNDKYNKMKNRNKNVRISEEVSSDVSRNKKRKSRKRIIESSSRSSDESDDDHASVTLRQKNYTLDEDTLILKYINKYDLYSFVRGNSMWMDLEKRKLLPGRSWHSLKERFRKRIFPRLDTFEDISQKYIEKFKKFNLKNVPVEKRSSTKYSEYEDERILEYIIKHKRYKEIKAKSMWVSMSSWDPLNSRTWESLKNRFLQNIAPNLTNYDISEEALNNFKKALRRERGPPNFKKYKIPRAKRKQTPKAKIVYYTDSSNEESSCSFVSDESLSSPKKKDSNVSQGVNITGNESEIILDSCQSSSSETNREKIDSKNQERKKIVKPAKNDLEESETKSRSVEKSPVQNNSPENTLQKKIIMKRKLFPTDSFSSLYEATPKDTQLHRDFWNIKKQRVTETNKLLEDERTKGTSKNGESSKEDKESNKCIESSKDEGTSSNTNKHSDLEEEHVSVTDSSLIVSSNSSLNESKEMKPPDKGSSRSEKFGLRKLERKNKTQTSNEIKKRLRPVRRSTSSVILTSKLRRRKIKRKYC